MTGPVTPVAIASGLIQVDGSTPKILRGWSFRATTAGTVQFRDTNGTGQVLATVDLALNASTPPPAVLDEGIASKGGIFVELVSGAYTGSVYVE